MYLNVQESQPPSWHAANGRKGLELYIGIMENEMETTIVRWGHIGIMETERETLEGQRT